MVMIYRTNPRTSSAALATASSSYLSTATSGRKSTSASIIGLSFRTRRIRNRWRPFCKVNIVPFSVTWCLTTSRYVPTPETCPAWVTKHSPKRLLPRNGDSVCIRPSSMLQAIRIRPMFSGLHLRSTVTSRSRAGENPRTWKNASSNTLCRTYCLLQQ